MCLFPLNLNWDQSMATLGTANHLDPMFNSMVSSVTSTATTSEASDDLCLAGIQVMQVGGARRAARDERSFPPLGEMLTVNRPMEIYPATILM
jgi:hypothetical protein